MEKLTPAQRYYQKHKEARRAYGREYYKKNKDKILKNIETRKLSVFETNTFMNTKQNEGKEIEICNDVVSPKIILYDYVAPVASSPIDMYRGGGPSETDYRTTVPPLEVSKHRYDIKFEKKTITFD